MIKDEVIKYLRTNPIDDTAKNKYAEVMEKFKIDLKTASRYWTETKNKYILFKTKHEPANYTDKQIKRIIEQEGDKLSVSASVDFEVKSLEDLLEACEVDASKWQVISWQCKKWDLGIKNALDAIETKQLYSVSAKFRAIPVEANLPLQKDILLKELFKAPEARFLQPLFDVFDDTAMFPKKDADCLLELALFDMHFGKLAHKEESGEDYDIKIAVKRYKTAVKELLSRTNLERVERILLPVGQDLLNVDNLQGTTTAGTPQDNDSRFYKVVRTVKNVLIETINELAIIAPVDVVMVVGNHDEQSTFMVGEMLDAYYHGTDHVNVFNTASLRKYYQYGVTGLMFTHGNREKYNDLGMIFAAENPKLWAATSQRYIQIGHFHHNKKTNVLSTQEFQGFQVQIIPSLTANDAWHRGKGYLPLRQAKAFLYHKSQGLIAEFSYTDF